MGGACSLGLSLSVGPSSASFLTLSASSQRVQPQQGLFLQRAQSQPPQGSQLLGPCFRPFSKLLGLGRSGLPWIPQPWRGGSSQNMLPP